MATYRFNGLRYAQSEELFGHLGESTELSGIRPIPPYRHARGGKLPDNFTRREKIRLWSGDRGLLGAFRAARSVDPETQIESSTGADPSVSIQAVGELALPAAEVELEQPTVSYQG